MYQVNFRLMTGLRERKKWATRRHISDVATGLFLARGFDNVTITEIAEAANVSRMTIFNYFPRKEDLFLDRPAELIADFTEAITARAPDQSVVDALRALHRRWAAEEHPMSGLVENMATFWKVIDDTPALRARTLEQQREFVDALAVVLRAEGADEAQARLAAAYISGTHGTIFELARARLVAGEDYAAVRADQPAVAELAFDALNRALSGQPWSGPRHRSPAHVRKYRK
jgi:AcrR family transcriptional regulator